MRLNHVVRSGVLSMLLLTNFVARSANADDLPVTSSLSTPTGVSPYTPSPYKVSNAVSLKGTMVEPTSMKYLVTGTAVCNASPWVDATQRFGADLTVGDVLTNGITGTVITVTGVNSSTGALTSYSITTAGYDPYGPDLNTQSSGTWMTATKVANTSATMPCIAITNTTTVTSEKSYSLNDWLGDFNDIRRFGVDVNESDAAMLTGIQNTYDNEPDDGTLIIPRHTGGWTGTITTPDPNKHLTYIWFGPIPGLWTPPPGDGDATVSFEQGFNVERRDINTNSWTAPISGFYWNADQNYKGPWSSNWTQYTPLYLRAISGPTSTGNTGLISSEFDSYGQAPSGSYDVGISLNVNKYGQNSVWGIVDELADFSGRPPGAFSMWNEYDAWGNGYDAMPWSPSYGGPQSGARSIFFTATESLTHNTWAKNASITAPSYGQLDLPQPYIITVTASDGVEYDWYATQSGTTAATQPTFPVPAKVLATYVQYASTVTINSVVSGTISKGDTLVGSQPVHPMIIGTQVSGTTGGAGVYNISLSPGDSEESSFTNMAIYDVPTVTDGSVVWQFGQNHNETIESMLYITGGASVGTIVSGDGIKIHDAVVDTTAMTFEDSTDASLRMAAGQAIDFTGTATGVSGRNKHTLVYDTATSTLDYTVNGSYVLQINDQGGILTGNNYSITRGPGSESTLWIFGQTGSPSTDGTNSNGDFFINRYGDSSTTVGTGYLGTALTISRSTGDLETESNITADGSLKAKVSIQYPSYAYASLPSVPSGSVVYCSDCYTAFRANGDTSVGTLTVYNGTSWVDMVGVAINH